MTAAAALDLTPLAGVWRKTNEDLQWIDRLVIRIDDGKAVVRVFGSAPPSRPNWGESPAEAVYANAVDSSTAMALVTRYSFDECDIDVEVNGNIGLLVVGTFIRWHGGTRSDAFTREFFYRSDA
jgi:hypothetical protein